jgi:hypothetical protein
VKAGRPTRHIEKVSASSASGRTTISTARYESHMRLFDDEMEDPDDDDPEEDLYRDRRPAQEAQAVTAEAAAVATEASNLREFFEERTAILEHDAGLPRPEAEAEAARITAMYARNRESPWASLRAALSRYPVLAAQLPDRRGPVDSLARPRSTCARAPSPTLSRAVLSSPRPRSRLRAKAAPR